MPDQVPEPIKTKRSAVLLESEQKMSKEFRDYYLGKEVTALLEEEFTWNGKKYFTGYTKEYVKVAFAADTDLTNQFVKGILREELTKDVYLMVEF